MVSPLEYEWHTDLCPAAELPVLARLAGAIWRECYPQLIGTAQVEYMLERMYAVPQLEADARAGVRFLRLWRGGDWGGFAAVGETASPAEAKLHKFYLPGRWHGSGGATVLFRAAEEEAKRLGASRLVLAVNKRNDRAQAFYRKMGMAVYEEVVADIGGGFVMDDFLMAKGGGLSRNKNLT